MKVVFVGGMNNNNFAIVRYLRAQGVDAHLRLFKFDSPHFHPACDTFSTDFMEYTEELDWQSSWIADDSLRSRMRADLCGFDFLAGCGWLPAFAAAAGRTLDVMVPYGSDIVDCANYTLALRNLPQNLMIRYQRKGLRETRLVHMSPMIPMYENQIRTLMPKAERWLDGLPLIYHPEYDFGPDVRASRSKPTHWSDIFEYARESSDFMVVAHSRHYWNSPLSDPNHKGNDKYIRAWAAFLARNTGLKAKLVTCEYGPHVTESKKLIAQLGISDSIVWVPMLFRKDIMYGLHLCDAVLGDFTHSWTTGGVILESVVSGKPLITHRDEECLKGCGYFEVLNAYTTDDIASQLGRCIQQKDQCNAMGRKAREWYLYSLVQPVIEKYLRLFECKN
jgi:hypothetical protein